MLDWNKITDPVLLAHKKYLTDPIIEKLNLSEQEVGRYLQYIINTVNDKNKCAGLANNKCLNSNFQHYMLIRDQDGLLKLMWCDCPNHKKQLMFYNDYVIEQETSPFKDFPALYKHLNQNGNVQIPTLDAVLTINENLKKHKPTYGFYLYGDYGVGKSYFTNLFVQYIASIFKLTCAFVLIPKLVRKLKNSFDTKNNLVEELINQYANCDLLVFDDIGAERTNEWFYSEFLFNILNERMIKHKLTFFTSNLSLKELTKRIAKNGEMSNVETGRIIERIKALVQKNIFQWKGSSYRIKD